MKRISLIHPSRGRANKSFANAMEWILNAGNVDVELILSIDNDDPQREQYIKNYSASDAKIIQSDNKSVVEATNIAARHSTGDILIYLSDDFLFPPNWGTLVIQQFENENRPLLLKVNDCLQPFETCVLTIPMMNRMLYDKLGYFWHPEYKSMFCDEGLFWTVFKIGALKKAKNLKFPHHHACNGKADNDETYMNSAANWEQGKAVFARHKALGFPI